MEKYHKLLKYIEEKGKGKGRRLCALRLIIRLFSILLFDNCNIIWILAKYAYVGRFNCSYLGNAVLLEEEVEGLNLLISRLEESPAFQAAIPIQIAEPKLLLKVSWTDFSFASQRPILDW